MPQLLGSAGFAVGDIIDPLEERADFYCVSVIDGTGFHSRVWKEYVMFR